MRVNRAIEDGSFFENEVLLGAFERGRRVHLLGLVSHGGVHSHIDHLQALLRFAPEKTWIHAFTDGRDVSPTSAIRDLALLPQDRIATVTGRYYAMDRDARWERTQRAFDAIVNRVGTATDDPLAAVQASYDAGVTDEFIEPIVVDGAPALEPGDTAIFFNFRPDRGRQLSQAAARPRRRPDDDDPVRVRPPDARRVRGAGRAADARRGARGERSEAAPRRRDGEVRTRDVLLQRRPRGRRGRARTGSSSRARATCRATTTSRRCRPTRSPTASSTRSATATRSASSTSRTRTWSATPARSRPSSRPARPPTAASAASSSA